MGNVMNNNTGTESKLIGRGGVWGWLKRNAVSLLTLLLIVVVTAVLFYYRDRVAELGNYAYLSSFLIGLIANATVILPMPGLGMLLGLAAIFNPFLVGLTGAAGGALGEMTGYLVGRGGRKVVQGNKWYVRADAWMKKRGFVTVFLFALLPVLPMDVAGLVAGVSRFPIWKFLLACFLGKTVKYVAFLQTGSWGWDILLRYIG